MADPGREPTSLPDAVGSDAGPLEGRLWSSVPQRVAMACRPPAETLAQPLMVPTCCGEV